MDLKVLLIEDEEISKLKLGNFIKKNFKCIFFDAIEADNGLKIIKDEKIDIVITDIKLPKKSGLDLIREIRQFSNDIQVILITGFGKSDYIIEAIIMGAVDFLQKPIDTNQLLISLERAKEKISTKKAISVKTTILIAEDDDLARRNIAEILRDEDKIVLEACNGQEAVNIFFNNKIDIALLDIKMPKKTGSEALIEMRKCTQDFEAIILTGYSDNESAIQALRGGAFYYLKKPLDLDSLILLIQKAEEKLNLQRALLYRNRENELMGIVINKLSQKEDKTIQLANSQIQLFQSCLDMLPISLLLIDSAYNFKYTNRQFKAIFNTNSLDDYFIEKLQEVKINVNLDELKQDIGKVFNIEIGQSYNNKRYSEIIFSHTQIVNDDNLQENFVLILIRIKIENIEFKYK